MAYAATIPVTYENYGKAQTSMQMNDYLKLAKGINKWYKFRTPTTIDNQPTIRMNRATLYNISIVDISKGATITLPDAGTRYMSLAIFNEFGYEPFVYYGKGTYTLTPEKVGSDYAFLFFRALVDANSPKDVAAVHALQDAVTIKANSAVEFKMPNWDMDSYKKVFESLLPLFAMSPNSDGMFGAKSVVNPVLFLVGLAGGFGGLPSKDAAYFNAIPDAKGKAFTMHLKDVPVDGFWSITAYNKEGYLFASKHGLPSLNNLTAKPSADGSYTLYFGNCEKNTENCIGITKGWSYVTRFYRPRPEVLSGKWVLPALQPVK